jgi:nicotinamide mononucleotide transporter
MTDIVAWLGGWIAVFGVITGAGSVYFLAKQKGLIGWTLGIINAVFFIILFTGEKLYADTILNSYYFITSSLGLYLWLRNRDVDGKVLKIKRLTTSHLAKCLAFVAVFTLGLGWFLDTQTEAFLPYIDSFTTGLSFVGQYLLARKFMNNWYFWITANVIDIGLYGSKGLWAVVAMTVLYTVFCFMGLRGWKRTEVDEAQASVLPFGTRVAERAAG